MEKNIPNRPDEAKTSEGSILHKLVDEALPFEPIYKSIIEESIKSAPLFITGNKGLALTLVTHALAEAKPEGSVSEKITDGLAGAGKGLLVRKGFEAFGRLSPALELLPTKYELALRGMGLGVVSRFADTAGSLDTWRNKEGKVDLARGAQLTGASVLSPVSLGCDIVSFGLAKGMHVGLNSVTKGLVDRNAMLSMSVMGSAFGMNGGAIGEYVRQLKDNESFDLRRVAEGAFVGGAAGGLASIPGGYQLHLHANKIVKSMDYHTHDSASKAPVTRANSESKTNSWQFLEAKPTLRYAQARELDDAASMELPKPDYPPLSELNKRIIRTHMTDEHFPFWKALDPTKPPGPDNGSVGIELCSTHNYSIDGHTTQISIPATYSGKLFSAREGLIWEFQLKRDGEKAVGPALEDLAIEKKASSKFFDAETYRRYKDRLLPEHVVRHLDELPNSNLIKKIQLLEDRLASDYKDSPGHFTRADADVTTGKMRTFALNYDHKFQRTMRHEWSHFLEGAYPQRYKGFLKALAIEDGINKDAANPRHYACENKRENWAVIGETLLMPEGKTFIEWLNKAPNRSCVFSLALADSLVQNPAETSIHRDQLAIRTSFVKSELVPRLQKQLLGELKDLDAERYPHLTKDRIGLLAEISGPDYLNQIVPLLKTTQSPNTIKEIVTAGLEHLSGQPEKQVDFLFSLPKDTRLNEVLSDAVFQIPIETFANHYLPKLKELETKTGKDKETYEQAFALFDLRCWHHSKFNELLPNEPAIYWLNRAEQSKLTHAHDQALANLEAAAAKSLEERKINEALNLYEQIIPIKLKLTGHTPELIKLLVKTAELSEIAGNYQQLEHALEELKHQ